MEPIETLVPNKPSIELVAYYPTFLNYYRECELQTKRWFVEHVEPNWVMFDAGANIGYYSILFSRLACQGTVYAFEPTETIEMLKANLTHNGCSNVIPLEIALGRSSGMREDNVFRIWGDEPERRMFEFSTVDDMVSRLGLDRLDCLKIDVDSFDYDVLRGTENTLRELDPWIVVELNDALFRRNQSARQAFEWLYLLGYRDAYITDDENHIFKRSGKGLQARTALPSLNLSFDSQPLIIPPPWVKGDLLETAFELDPRQHNSAFAASEIGGGCPWIVTAPGPQWSYAASWLRSKRELPDRQIIVEVDLYVTGGAVGIGCIKDDETGYLELEVQLAPLPALQTVAIGVEHPSEIGYLMVRNADPEGTTADVRVRSIGAYLAVQSKMHEDPLLSSKKRYISLTECSAALAGVQPSAIVPTNGERGIDILPVAQLGQALDFNNAFVPEIRIYRHGLADFRSEIDEAAVFAYIFREFHPARVVSSSKEAWLTRLCRTATNSEIAFFDEIVDISSNRASFDCALIDGRHCVEDVIAATSQAVAIVRSGGLIIWREFCPDVETLRRSPACRRVMSAFVDCYSLWEPDLAKAFWIRPSWILLGRRT